MCDSITYNEPIYTKNELQEIYFLLYKFPAFIHFSEDHFKDNKILKDVINENIRILKGLLEKNVTDHHSFIPFPVEIFLLEEFLKVFYCNLSDVPLYINGIYDYIVRWRLYNGK